jgi:hypothetical protein
MGTLVASDSPIRVRADLHPRQALQLDAVAVAANMIDFMYTRLAKDLAGPDPEEPKDLDPLLPDAWGIVDWVHRMDGLVRNGWTGTSTRLPFVRDYLDTSSLVENLRHQIQHLEETVPALAPSGRSPWGHMTWIRRLEPGPEGNRRFTLRVAGSALIGARDPEFRFGQLRPARTDVDYVSLYSGDGTVEIGLTGQHEALLRFIPALEDQLRSATWPPDEKGILRLVPPK